MQKATFSRGRGWIVSFCAYLLLTTPSFSGDEASGLGDNVGPPAASPVREPELTQVLEAFDAAQMNAASIVAEFTEEKRVKLLTQPIVSRGIFYFRRPNQVRWEYRAPESKVYVITEEMYVAYFPSLKRAERVPISRFVGRRLFRFIGLGQSIADLGTYYQFRLEKLSGLPGTHLLVLTPRKKRIQEHIEEMKIWVDATTFLPRRLQYVEAGGDSTTISFRQTRPNEYLSPVSFEIRLPEDVAVSKTFDGFALGGRGF